MGGFGRCVVVGGSGQVGRLFATLLADGGSDVVCLDVAPPEGIAGDSRMAWHAGDVVSPDAATAELLASADVLLVAVPEPVALAAIPTLAGHLRPEALFVDTLSVKTHIAAEVDRQLPGHPAVSLNPMFAPALGFAGRVVAAAVLRDGERVRQLLDLIRGAGAEVVAVTPDEHDRVNAVTQAATHAAVLAFGLAAAELGVDVATLRALAPPPHETLLALLARIASGAPEVYWDVQDGNPQAPRAREALRSGVERLSGVRDGKEFAELLDGLRGFLGDIDRSELAYECQTIFNTLHPGSGAHWH